LAQRDGLSIKIEVNTVIRGALHPAQTRSLTAAASDALMADLELPLLSPEDIYGGKLVAAMDRQWEQHFMQCAIVAGQVDDEGAPDRRGDALMREELHDIEEIARMLPKNIQLAYEGTFVGMTTEPMALSDLVDTREWLFRELPAALDADEREFLRTLVQAQPDWSLLGIPHLEELPAIRWRLQNLEQLSRSQPGRFRALATALDQRLKSISKR
jgi:hypothetical protein